MLYDIYITGEVGYYPCKCSAVAEMLAAKGEGAEVHAFVSSYGGDLQTAFQIRALFAAHGNVVCHLHGYVASAATVICTGAKETLVGEEAQYLIHRSRSVVDVYQYLDADGVKECAEQLVKVSDTLTAADASLAALYAAKCGRTAEECLALMDEEKWLTAAEAVAFGLCDAYDYSAALPAPAPGTSNADPAAAAKLCAAYGLPAPIAAKGVGEKGAAAPAGEAGNTAAAPARKGADGLAARIAAAFNAPELNRLKIENARLAAQLANTGRDLAAAEDGLTAAKEEAAAARAELDALKAAQEETERRLRAAEALCAALESDNAKLKARADELAKLDGAEDGGTPALATAAPAEDGVRARYEALKHLL